MQTIVGILAFLLVVVILFILGFIILDAIMQIDKATKGKRACYEKCIDTMSNGLCNEDCDHCDYNPELLYPEGKDY